MTVGTNSPNVETLVSSVYGILRIGILLSSKASNQVLLVSSLKAVGREAARIPLWAQALSMLKTRWEERVVRTYSISTSVN